MDTETTDSNVLRPAGLLRALGFGFNSAWDRLGLMVGVSLVSTVIALPAVFSLQMLPSLFGIILFSWIVGTPVMVGIFVMAGRIVFGDDPSLGDVADGFRRFLWQGYGLSLLNILVATVLTADTIFFVHLIHKVSMPIFPIAAAVISGYLLLGWLASVLYQLPILVSQESFGQSRGVFQAVRRSLLLVIGNPLFTIGLFVVILGFGILSTLSVIGMLILYAGVAPVLLTSALRELYARYGIVEIACEDEDAPEIG